MFFAGIKSSNFEYAFSAAPFSWAIFDENSSIKETGFRELRMLSVYTQSFISTLNVLSQH